MEKRLDNIVDVYSNTVALIKRLSTYNLYDLQATDGILENFHRKLTSLKVKELKIVIDTRLFLFLLSDGSFT